MTISRCYMRLVDGLDGRRPERLLDAFFGAGAEASALRGELELSRRRGRAAEEHLRAVTASRGWKLLSALNRFRAGLRGALDRLRRRSGG